MTAESGDSMTERVDEFDVDRLFDLASEIDEYVLEFKQAIVEGDEESELAELAEDLWEVLDAIEDILQQIDFEEIPEAIDVDDIPEAVDVENVPEGLFDEEENAIELTSVKEAVNLRELWNAVDLTDLYQEKQELEDEVDEATDHWEDEGDGDRQDELLDTDLIGDGEDADEDDELFENVVDMGEGAHVEFDAEARQAAIEEKIRDAVVKFREMLLTTHEKLEKLYRMNQEKLGLPGRQPKSLNPTATSTMPGGPVPESASLRTSTVPSQVKYSRIENPRRIYAHRFREATEDESDDQQSADEDAEKTDVEEGKEGEIEAEEDEETEAKEGGDSEPRDENGETTADTDGEVETTQLEVDPDTDEEWVDEDEEIIIEVHDE